MKLSQKLLNELSDEKLKLINQGIDKGINLLQYVNPRYNLNQIKVIKKGLELGIDISLFNHIWFNENQMCVLLSGVLKGIDISKYAKPYYTEKQMQLLIDNENLSKYSHPKYDEDFLEYKNNEYNEMVNQANSDFFSEWYENDPGAQWE